MSLLFVNRLTVIDFSHLHPERGLLGESWLVDIELEGTLDEQGMVLDFGLVKKQVKTLIDEEFDHKLLIPMQNANVQLAKENNLATLLFKYANKRQLTHCSPMDAVCAIDSQQITVASVGVAIQQRLQQLLPDNVDKLTLRLYPEEHRDLFYHYSHGLKYHDGNCRRIAHGHRSRIHIERDGARDIPLEIKWSERWKDIYIGSREDLADQFNCHEVEYYSFAYNTNQGQFELNLPAECCYLIDTESTVENIAQHIADQLQREQPNSQFMVRAFEGVGKGAIGCAGE